MQPILRFEFKLDIAQFTFKLVVIHVILLVHVQRTLLSESLSAHVTRERLLPRVNEHVLLQIGPVQEHTIAYRARVIPNLHVGLVDVPVELRFPRALLSAQMACEVLVLHVRRVYVISQNVHPLEEFSAEVASFGLADSHFLVSEKLHGRWKFFIARRTREYCFIVFDAFGGLYKFILVYDGGP
jgi:hypothetical protein